MRRALSIHERQLGADNPVVGTDLANLSALLCTTGRMTEAEPLMRRAITVFESSFGEDNPKVAISLLNLSTFYFMERRLSEAEPLVRRALEILLKSGTVGRPHPQLQMTINAYTGLLHQMGYSRTRVMGTVNSICEGYGISIS